MTYPADKSSGEISPAYLLWGKTPDKNHQGDRENLYHPLLFHMLDVAAVTSLLWDNCFPTLLKNQLKESLGDAAREAVIFFSGAHDIGNASPTFREEGVNIYVYLLL